YAITPKVQIEGPVQDAIVLSHWKAQSFKNDQHIDLYDFCACLAKSNPELADLCRAVMEAIKKVVLLSCTTGAAFQYSNGLSVFFPWADIEVVEGQHELKIYGELAWAKS